MSSAADILIVGAGPTGLALALEAHVHGANVRIVERRFEAFRPSRALILHPRTLEVLRPLGVTEALLARAKTGPEAFVHLGRVVHAWLGELALYDTAFPFLSLVRQADVEAVLTEALASRGVDVERGKALIGIRDGAECAHATLQSQFVIEHVACNFVVGCDDQMSTIRRAARIGWRGGPYGEEVILADVELESNLTQGAAHGVVGRKGLLFAFPLGEQATWRLLATRPAGHDRLPFGQPGPAVKSADLQVLLNEAGLDARITKLAWSARYGLQHRLATRFRQGHLFLAGDAAHTYSPATGQGMNTGIQDGVNLGWKLAFSPSSTDSAGLLDSYELERRPVARQVLAVTHLAFWVEASTGLLPSIIRGAAAPLVGPILPGIIGNRRLVAEAVRLISQLRTAYPKTPVSSEGKPGLSFAAKPGHRLPDAIVTCGTDRVRLHSLIARPGIHVLLQRDALAIEDLDLGPRVTTHRLASARGSGVVAVRPDGYIGFRCGTADVAQLHAWLARVGALNLGSSSGTRLR
jgi:2-polyprenyl-6-methoxyphenol hydroxylase-like FAD-dependent oxidoreductase